MQRSFRTTLVLAALLVVASVWYLAYEKNYKPKHTEEEENTKKLVTLERDQIQEVDIERSKKAVASPTANATPTTPTEYEKVKLRKSGSDWNIAEPLQTPADSTVIGAILNTITSTKQERVVDDKPKDLDVFGLKNPLIKIIVRKDANSPAQEVDLGTNTPTGYSSYAKIAGKAPVFRVSQTLRSNFDKGLKDLRAKNFVNVARTEIGEVEIQLSTKEDIILKKDSKDNWTLERENIAAENNEVNKLLNAISDLKATDFPSEDGKNPGNYGLTAPSAKITLTKSKDNSRVSVWLGKTKDKVYAQIEGKPTIYEVGKDILDKVEKPGSAYRNMQLAVFNRFNIQRVKLERGGDIVELLKDKGNWSMPTEPTTQVDSGKVDALLTNLQDIKIDRFTKDSVAKPGLTIRLFEKKDQTESQTVVLKFGKAKAKLVSVDREGLKLPFDIKEDDFKKIDLGKSAFIAAPKAEKKQTNKEPTKKG